MKSIRIICLTALLLPCITATSQENSMEVNKYWQIGFGLGELPIGGSFKPSISVGYHFNDKIYAGIIYQFRDEIQRNGSSLNARSSGMDGLLNSSEIVAQRFLFQVRYTPVKHGPYVSAGFVYNGKDTETMLFDSRTRELSGVNYDGSIFIQQSRPAGWGFALGLGYQYNFRNGFSTGFEWTPAWGQYPVPDYVFKGEADLTDETQSELRNKMNDEFKSSVTNMYKVFHIGVAYRF
jgi:hypothetical protein